MVDPERVVLKERLACFNGKEGFGESVYGHFVQGGAVCHRLEGWDEMVAVEGKGSLGGKEGL
jgi:hypothetical protein